MEKLVIEPTKSTPYVQLDAENHILKIRGQSFPENAFLFYQPILRWIDSFLKTLEKECLIEFNLDYLNTSSSKCLMDIIDKLNDAHQDGKLLKILWYYDSENENGLELAKEFMEDMEIPFKILAVKSDPV